MLIVQTTFSDKDEAVEFAKKILLARLAACIQLSGEAESFYWWKGAIEKDQEIIVTMKTMETLYPQLEAYITKIHSYETPEILATTVKHVGSGYLQWLHEELGGEKKKQ